MSNGRLSPTEQRIYDLLSDGLSHNREELHACLDELANSKALTVFVTHMRAKLRPKGEDIICEYQYKGGWPNRSKSFSYRLARLLASPYNE